MIGNLQVYNPTTQKFETYYINGGFALRGEKQKAHIAGDVPESQHIAFCKAVRELEKVLLNAQGWDGKMNRVDNRD